MKRSLLPIGSETHPSAVWCNGKPLQSLGFTRYWAACDIGYARQSLVFKKALSGWRNFETHAKKVDTAQGWLGFASSHLAILLKKRAAGGTQSIGFRGRRVGRESEA